MRRPRSGRIGLAVRTVRISIFGQKRDASLPGHNVDCVATGAHWDGRCDRSAVGTARRAVPRVARLLVALAARDPRLLYRPLRGRGPVCLSEGQTRGISALTGNTVAPALRNNAMGCIAPYEARASDTAIPTASAVGSGAFAPPALRKNAMTTRSRGIATRGIRRGLVTGS